MASVSVPAEVSGRGIPTSGDDVIYGINRSALNSMIGNFDIDKLVAIKSTENPKGKALVSLSMIYLADAKIRVGDKMVTLDDISSMLDAVIEKMEMEGGEEYIKEVLENFDMDIVPEIKKKKMMYNNIGKATKVDKTKNTAKETFFDAVEASGPAGTSGDVKGKDPLITLVPQKPSTTRAALSTAKVDNVAFNLSMTQLPEIYTTFKEDIKAVVRNPFNVVKIWDATAIKSGQRTHYKDLGKSFDPDFLTGDVDPTTAMATWLAGPAYNAQFRRKGGKSGEIRRTKGNARQVILDVNKTTAYTILDTTGLGNYEIPVDVVTYSDAVHGAALIMNKLIKPCKRSFNTNALMGLPRTIITDNGIKKAAELGLCSSEMGVVAALNHSIIVKPHMMVGGKESEITAFDPELAVAGIIRQLCFGTEKPSDISKRIAGQAVRQVINVAKTPFNNERYKGWISCMRGVKDENVDELEKMFRATRSVVGANVSGTYTIGFVPV
jgi:hypothetical protein